MARRPSEEPRTQPDDRATGPPGQDRPANDRQEGAGPWGGRAGVELRQPGTEVDPGDREAWPEKVEPGRAGGTPPEEAPTESSRTLDNPETKIQERSRPPATGTLDPTDPGRVEDYELIAELGRGGMGVVYKARQRKLNRLVALKVIRDGSHAHPGQVARFQVEAEAVARLRHDHIVQVYDVGVLNGLPFVALELLEGGSLADRLGGTPQPGRSSAELVHELALAIDTAHSAGIVHRDLKPSNILFSREGVAKIVDFGLAKRLEVDQGQTETGQVMGTPSYMAPEQAGGRTREIGPAADVYALGAILYEMLVGRPPFKGLTTIETMKQVTDDDPLPPSRLQPRVSRDLETIALKCLAKEPHRRYVGAKALADDLGRFLEGEPIRARPTPSWERGLKWARRRPTTATLVALAAAAAVVAGVAGVHHEARERARQSIENERLVRLQGTSAADLLQAQEALSRQDWDQGTRILAPLVAKLEPEPRLGALRARALAMLEDAYHGLSEQKARRADEQVRARDRARYEEFLRLRDEALFRDAQFTGPDQPGNREATRKAAEAALGVFAAPGKEGDWRLAGLPASLGELERAEIVEGCYELFLVLAEGERPDQGLKVLDRAARIRPKPTRAYHLARAHCLDRGGEHAAATDQRAQADRLAPDTAFDHFLAGFERYKAREWKAALRHFDAALGKQSDHFWANCLSAIASIQLQRPSEAKPGLNACLRRRPEAAWLYILRGFAAGQLAAREGDEAQFEAAEADYGKALAILERAPDDELRYGLLVDRGLMEFFRGRLDRAAADLEAAARLDDRRYQAFAELARVYQRQGKSAEAIEALGRAISLRPDWPPLYRARAELLMGLDDLPEGRRKGALRDLDETIRRESPGNPVLARDHTNRGRLLHQEGRDDEALAACTAALEVVPDYADAHRLRVGILLGRRRYDEVIAACDEALTKGKRSAELLELRGLARAARKDFAAAIGDYSQALELRPGSPATLARRGWAYLLSDAPRLALHDFEESIRLDPSTGDSYNGRGTARLQLGDYRAAVVDAEEALRRGKPSPRTSYNAARVYAQAGEAAAAEVRKSGRPAADLAAAYHDRAVRLIREALERTPADQRATFLKETIRNDPALRAIRRRLKAAGPDG